MPGGTSNGSSDAASGESRGAKRARLAFNRDDMDLDPVKTPEYARWERWRDHAAATAYGFLDSADAGIMAARYQERLMRMACPWRALIGQWSGPAAGLTPRRP